MKVPLSWLKDYIKEPFDVDDLAYRLTMAGTEVAGIETIGESWEGVCVGLVTAVNPHPDADRLRLVTVDSGGQVNEVVCGAPNVAAGQKIAYARVGACLINGYTGEVATLKPAKIRGVVSSGMVCSEKELGLSDEHEGILELPADAPLGMPLKEYMGETILDLEVTPNRPDMLSVTGVACEAAALLGLKANVPEPEFTGEGNPVESEVSIEIEALDLCPRYCASLIKGIKIGESPRWLKSRLISAGMRPINNVVDITNYVMLEFGQPLHAFDFDRIAGSSIVVRRASEGSAFTTLDDIERKLTGEMLMICDEAGEVAIAGVMGGANSEVSSSTANILIESASFKPASIHFTASHLGLSSAASQRFERGLSPMLTVPALKRATELVLCVAGGTAASGIIDASFGLQERQPLSVDVKNISGMIGREFSSTEVTRLLELLGCCVTPAGDGTRLSVMPPRWRSDINLEADVVEEVARISGYENIPLTMLSKSIPQQTPDPKLSFKKKFLAGFTGLGFQEILSWSMTNKSILGKALNQSPLEIPPLHLKKPMSLEQECLRTSLRPHLMSALASNRRFEDGAICLFEMGAVYISQEKGLPEEPCMVNAAITSSQVREHWAQDPAGADFFSIKGIAESILASAGITPLFEPSDDTGFKPGSQAAVKVSGQYTGIVGEVHPKVCRAFDIAEPVFMLELNMTRLLALCPGDRLYRPVFRYPAVVRDIALVLDDTITHSQVMAVLGSFPLVADVRLFDVYTGKHVPEGSRSMAYRLTFQSEKKTLTDDSVDAVLARILSRLQGELGAVLRS